MEERKDGLVTLSLSSDEIEEELANMEDLEAILLTKLLRKADRDELKKTFRVAMTARDAFASHRCTYERTETDTQ